MQLKDTHSIHQSIFWTCYTGQFANLLQTTEHTETISNTKLIYEACFCPEKTRGWEKARTRSGFEPLETRLQTTPPRRHSNGPLFRFADCINCLLPKKQEMFSVLQVLWPGKKGFQLQVTFLWFVLTRETWRTKPRKVFIWGWLDNMKLICHWPVGSEVCSDPSMRNHIVILASITFFIKINNWFHGKGDMGNLRVESCKCAWQGGQPGASKPRFSFQTMSWEEFSRN